MPQKVILFVDVVSSKWYANATCSAPASHHLLMVDATTRPRGGNRDVLPSPTPRLFPKCHDPLEELCASLKMPQDYASRLRSLGLSYGAVITMPHRDLMMMLSLIMSPEHGQLFARHVLLINAQQRNDGHEHLPTHW